MSEDDLYLFCDTCGQAETPPCAVGDECICGGILERGGIAMREKTEVPSEDDFLAAEKVADWMKTSNGSWASLEFWIKATLREKRLELYPPQSCATCDFCLGPCSRKDSKQVHFCVSLKRLAFIGLVQSCERDVLPKSMGTLCDFHSKKQPLRQEPEEG